MSTTRQQLLVVHLLRAGFTLCRRPDLPKDWPPHHRFVTDRERVESVTCPLCLAVLHETTEHDRRRR